MSTAIHTARTRVRRGLRLRGLTWLIWRQNRVAFLIGLAAAAAVTVYAAVQHQHATAAIAAQHLDACRGGTVDSTQCTRDLLSFGKEYQYPLRRALQAVLLLPFLIGVFLGGPQLAQELESGTYRTVATQSVTRLRWFAAKLGVPLVMTVIVSGVTGAAMTWWWHPIAKTMGSVFPWSMWYPFYGIGPVVVGLSVLFYLLGATLGLFLRRTVAAMGATLVAGAALFALIEWARPHLWPIRTVNAQHTTEPPAPDSAWLLADGPLSKDGRRVSDVVDCYAQTDYRACLKTHGISGHWAEYHPASHLWALQWSATGVCLALGAALVALSVWRMRRHSA
ncbi:ABC transporter permease [Streptomyces sp. NPDC047841]|uniref:ABC transporter permease n=1 Tax=Streptomyces sp. NPDC047841 TaxID=3154708 RepID=UPI0034528B62